ncbi:cytochrome P450 [Streptomyces sp. NPDC090077]|uniref:cytochrome P450 n=1 Tax=Streptomyces sp. NPDC090077 TaxID=3365938 RepID=UPI003821C53B
MSENTTPPPAPTFDPARVRRAVDERLAAFLDAMTHRAASQGFPTEVTDVLGELVLGGGKRIRPVLCAAGWHAGGGSGDQGPMLQVAASLEMFHAFALVHDDVMDRSATRRGRPSVHQAVAARHSGHPDAAWLGTSAAVLLGDLALAWSDELLHTAGLSPDRLAAAAAVMDEMRTELMFGQYLDLLTTGRPSADLEAALRIARLKSGRYTVERPLQLGAVLAGADAEVGAVLSAFGLPLGEAFQLRDDLLGAFGTSDQTGKPEGEDLRAGKHTPLLALALRRADPAERGLLTACGRPGALGTEQVARIRAVLEGTGARAEVEAMVEERRGQALRVLEESALPAASVEVLGAVAATLTGADRSPPDGPSPPAAGRRTRSNRHREGAVATKTDTPSPVPRAPGALPLLGHAPALLRDPLGFLRSLPQHGNLVAVGLGPHPALVVCEPRLLHHVLVDDHLFDKGGPLYDRFRDFIGNGLLTCPHHEHRRQRRLVQPAFHPRLMPGYARTMAAQFTEAAGTWREGQAIDVLHATQEIASKALIATLFGAGPDPADAHRLADDAAVLVAGAWRQTIQPSWAGALPTPANLRCRRAVRRLRAAVTAYVAQQHGRSDAGLMLDALLAARDTEDGGQGLSDSECVDQVLLFLLAGTETTAVVLAWAMHLLATRPGLEHELRAEAVGATDPADVGQLVLTGAVITETLRLYPPAWLTMRTTTADTVLDGHRVPTGTTVVVSPYLIHHRPDLYPDPERFDPGRWTGRTGSAPSAPSAPSREAFVPFGGGARKCIGDRFALTESVLALAAIVRRWHLAPPDGAAFRMPRPLTTLQPTGLRLRVTTPDRQPPRRERP